MIVEIKEIEVAQKKVAATITANEGDGVWPFDVWEAWQEFDAAVVRLRAAYERVACRADPALVTKIVEKTTADCRTRFETGPFVGFPKKT